MGRHQNDRQLWFGGVQLGDQFQAAQAGQSQVGHDHIVNVFPRPGQAVVAAAGQVHFIAFGAEHFLQGGRGAGVIFDEQ